MKGVKHRSRTPELVGQIIIVPRYYFLPSGIDESPNLGRTIMRIGSP
jgi:hypothetical protein